MPRLDGFNIGIVFIPGVIYLARLIHAIQITLLSRSYLLSSRSAQLHCQNSAQHIDYNYTLLWEEVTGNAQIQIIRTSFSFSSGGVAEWSDSNRLIQLA